MRDPCQNKSSEPVTDLVGGYMGKNGGKCKRRKRVRHKTNDKLRQIPEFARKLPKLASWRAGVWLEKTKLEAVVGKKQITKKKKLTTSQ